MTSAPRLRRLALVAAAALLAMSIGAQPLYAIDADNPDSATQKKADRKAKPAKVKRERAEEKAPQHGMQGYRPDAVPGSGY
jgi:hypothetical protein